jgi:SAM-dependent methyltransferase
MIKNLPSNHDYLSWDSRCWSKSLHYWETHVPWNRIKNALELGANQGGLSLWLAQKGIQVICSDLSDSEKSAYPLHQKFGMEKLISYQDIDATRIPYESHFDLVVCKSVLGGIGRDNDFEKQKLATQEIYKALKPGGIFLFAENLSASALHQFMRRYFVKWGHSWRYPNMTELRTLTGEFSSVNIQSHGFFSAFGRTEKQRNLLSRADDLMMPLIPENLRYVGYGIAVR